MIFHFPAIALPGKRNALHHAYKSLHLEVAITLITGKLMQFAFARAIGLATLILTTYLECFFGLAADDRVTVANMSICRKVSTFAN